MFLSYFAIFAYLAATFLLVRYFIQDSTKHPHQGETTLFIGLALVAHALNFAEFYTADGVLFGLAHSTSAVAWLIAVLLFLSSWSKPVHSLGILVYPLVAFALIFSLTFPDKQAKIIPFYVASHVFLSITAYALLALCVCQSMLLKIQEQRLHEHKIDGFINKLPPLQTMERLLFQALRIGFYLLTLSLITGFIFIDDFFAQHLSHKTVLSLIAWFIFAALVFGRKIFGWRGKQVITATQVGFALLLVGYFGSKLVLERVLA